MLLVEGLLLDGMAQNNKTNGTGSLGPLTQRLMAVSNAVHVYYTWWPVVNYMDV